MAPSSEALTDAILKSVQHGEYPDSEAIASADLSTDALPSLLQALDTARDEIKTDIRDLSREAAPDIDGWIAQAKQLQADIERSKATAREIVQQAEAGKALQSNIDDASSKVGLLQNELAFNGTLSETLVRIKDTKRLLDEAQGAAVARDVITAINKLENVDQSTVGKGSLGSARVSGLLQNRVKSLRNDLIEETLRRWNMLITFDYSRSRVVICNKIEQEGSRSISIADVAMALVKLDLLEVTIGRFCKDLIRTIRSRFATGKSKTSGPVEFTQVEEQDILEMGPGSDNDGVGHALEDFIKIIKWLTKCLPSMITTSLSSMLLPPLISQFIKDWLQLTIPLSLEGMRDFENALEKISDTAESIGNLGWAGREELVEWVDAAPRTWLTKRREATLDAARRVMLIGLKETKTVERVETEMVAKDDVLGGGTEQTNDDWDEAWEEGENRDPQGPSSPIKDHEDEEDEDASAWDMEDDAEESKANNQPHATKIDTSGANEEDDDAWGWNEEDQGSPNATKSPIEIKKQEPKMNGSKPITARPTEREVTLKETLTVTSVPDGILEVILQVIADAEGLAKPEFSQSTIAPAATGLYLLPTLVLAMYRATASTYYSTLPASNMYIYNDSARLSSQLRSSLLPPSSPGTGPPRPSPSPKLKLDPDLRALDSLSRRAYAHEMDAQRTILRDLLDSAQGFANCTAPPFAHECDRAVAMTVDRVREVHAVWAAILSRSALLQAVGALVVSVMGKVVADVTDMADISEAESKRLRGFCDEIAALSELFVQRGEEGEVVSDVTPYVVPNWFRFQYLGQIMESSLADIVYMWTESELRLEYEASEIVDLIEALFAESEHRRKAIGEIRKSGGGS